jgi:DNA-directed RNA polymerase subunit RPC12/RpoP
MGRIFDMLKEDAITPNIEDREYRCPHCSKLLMKGDVILVQVKCPRCKNIVTFRK